MINETGKKEEMFYSNFTRLHHSKTNEHSLERPSSTPCLLMCQKTVGKHCTDWKSWLKVCTYAAGTSTSCGVINNRHHKRSSRRCGAPPRLKQPRPWTDSCQTSVEFPPCSIPRSGKTQRPGELVDRRKKEIGDRRDGWGRCRIRSEPRNNNG